MDSRRPAQHFTMALDHNPPDRRRCLPGDRAPLYAVYWDVLATRDHEASGGPERPIPLLRLLHAVTKRGYAPNRTPRLFRTDRGWLWTTCYWSRPEIGSCGKTRLASTRTVGRYPQRLACGPAGPGGLKPTPRTARRPRLPLPRPVAQRVGDPSCGPTLLWLCSRVLLAGTPANPHARRAPGLDGAAGRHRLCRTRATNPAGLVLLPAPRYNLYTSLLPRD